MSRIMTCYSAQPEALITLVSLELGPDLVSMQSLDSDVKVSSCCSPSFRVGRSTSTQRVVLRPQNVITEMEIRDHQKMFPYFMSNLWAPYNVVEHCMRMEEL